MNNSERSTNIVIKNNKKKRKFLKRFLVFLSVLTVIIIMLGFIFPGLLWTKSLGIRYTEENYNSIINKLNYKTNNLTGDEFTYQYGEITSVDISFTSEELTAFINKSELENDLKNFQIKINSDYTIEIVCKIKVNYFLNEILNNKYSREEIENQVPGIGILPEYVNLYLKLSGSVTDNKSILNVHSIVIQGISVPDSMINDTQLLKAFKDGLDNIILNYTNKTGTSFTKIFVDNEQIRVQGNMPSSIERVRK